MYNNGQWTKARFHSFIKSVLRAGSMKWPVKYNVLNSAKRGKQVNSKTGRLAEHYECAECHGLFPAKEIAADHLYPVVPTTGFVSWDDVIERMFCEAEGLQVLCRSCHSQKSKIENAERKSHKNKNKESE